MIDKDKVEDGVVRGSNLLVAIFWTALGTGGIAAAASGFGGAIVVLCGIAALLYGLYGLYRVFM
jgi:hypothetical protein